MGGLLVLALIAGYIWVATKLVKSVQPYWEKALIVIAAILIPTADAVYGRIKLRQMCQAEGGLHTYRVVEGVDGFRDETSSLDYWVKEQGYRFIEDRLVSSGTTNRYSRQLDGSIVEEKHVLPKSQFQLRNVYPDENKFFSRHGFQIEEIATGEVLSMHTWLTFNGGWAERLTAKFSDAGGGNVARCPNVPSRLDAINRLVNSTLKH
jgi:hypothetical protein